jgi:hypothetical protein
MGIIVTDGVLPSGVPVSNVYISFSSETVYVSSKNSIGLYTINAYYKVFKDNTKEPNSDIRIPLFTQVSDISVGVFDSLYAELKKIYPNSTDDVQTMSYPAGMTEAEYNRGINLKNIVSLYISEHLGNNIEELENAYQAVEDIFGITGPATAELDTLETMYNQLI